MSAGYASRLSEYKNKGLVGLAENFDSKRQCIYKFQRLAEMVKASKHFVVLTGAGISTSAGIPDFRGPKGIWTLEKQQQQQQQQQQKKNNNKTKTTKKKNDHPRNNNKRKHSLGEEENPLTDFSKAQPTMTHRALTKLAQVGKVKYCATQNVDGLHRRAGLSRNVHSSIHGCIFTEKCVDCQTEYFRDYDVEGMISQPTGRTCTAILPSGVCCGGDLHGTLLDWEDELPEKDFERAEKECEAADLVLCLGTSLRIEPAGSLPLSAKKFVIVNLQPTPYDEHAAMIIKALVDEVMEDLMQKLGFDKKDWWTSESDPDIEYVWNPNPASSPAKKQKISPKSKMIEVK